MFLNKYNEWEYYSGFHLPKDSSIKNQLSLIVGSAFEALYIVYTEIVFILNILMTFSSHFVHKFNIILTLKIFSDLCHDVMKYKPVHIYVKYTS